MAEQILSFSVSVNCLNPSSLLTLLPWQLQLQVYYVNSLIDCVGPFTCLYMCGCDLTGKAELTALLAQLEWNHKCKWYCWFKFTQWFVWSYQIRKFLDKWKFQVICMNFSPLNVSMYTMTITVARIAPLMLIYNYSFNLSIHLLVLN